MRSCRGEQTLRVRDCGLDPLRWLQASAPSSVNEVLAWLDPNVPPSSEGHPPAPTPSHSLNMSSLLYCGLGLTCDLLTIRPVALETPPPHHHHPVVFKPQRLFHSNFPRIFFRSSMKGGRFGKVAIIKIGSKARLGFHLSNNAGLAQVPVAPYGDSGSLTRL